MLLENVTAVEHPNLGDVEPEAAGELELLLMAVVDEAHDDVALVDGLATQRAL